MALSRASGFQMQLYLPHPSSFPANVTFLRDTKLYRGRIMPSPRDSFVAPGAPCPALLNQFRSYTNQCLKHTGECAAAFGWRQLGSGFTAGLPCSARGPFLEPTLACFYELGHLVMPMGVQLASTLPQPCLNPASTLPQSRLNKQLLLLVKWGCDLEEGCA